MTNDDKTDDLSQLEQEFQEVLAELTDDPNLTKFRQEYEKVHSALKSSNASNIRLQAKCRELNSEIVANASKVRKSIAHEKYCKKYLDKENHIVSVNFKHAK